MSNAAAIQFQVIDDKGQVRARHLTRAAAEKITANHLRYGGVITEPKPWSIEPMPVKKPGAYGRNLVKSIQAQPARKS